MRATPTAKRGLVFAATSLFTITALAAPAFADQAIIGYETKGHNIGIVVLSCDKTEVAYKPVMVPTVGAAIELTKTNAADNTALLAALQRGNLPSLSLGPVSEGSKVAKADQNMLYLSGEIGIGRIAAGKGSELIFTGKKKDYVAAISGTDQQQNAAAKAFNSTKGTLANKLIAGAQALVAAGGIDSTCKTPTSAALLVAYRNDALLNSLTTFTPNAEDPKHAFLPDDPMAPSVFASVLLKPDSKQSALTELSNRVGTVAKTQTLDVHYNVYVVEAKAAKIMWMSTIGALIAAALIIALVVRQRRAKAALASARPKKEGNSASKPRKRRG